MEKEFYCCVNSGVRSGKIALDKKTAMSSQSSQKRTRLTEGSSLKMIEFKLCEETCTQVKIHEQNLVTPL